MKLLRRILLILLILIIVGAGGTVIWALLAAQPGEAALVALQSDADVTVSQDGWLTFRPTNGDPQTGLIFYPGARVNARAYAPTARAIAAAGYLVVIPDMPLNLAILGIGTANEVMAAHPSIGNWAIGGHSLGGASAALYVDGNPGKAEGLLFWAAYPPDSNPLTGQSSLAVTSIYGTLDGLATVDKVDHSRSLLPPATTFVPIEGGNHAQFGDYGPQSGDNPATISAEEQWAQTTEASIALLVQIDGPSVAAR